MPFATSSFLLLVAMHLLLLAMHLLLIAYCAGMTFGQTLRKLYDLYVRLRRPRPRLYTHIGMPSYWLQHLS